MQVLYDYLSVTLYSVLVECLHRLNQLSDVCKLLIHKLPRSSVARGGAIAPPIGMSTKMQNEKNITFLVLLRLFYALEWNK